MKKYLDRPGLEVGTFRYPDEHAIIALHFPHFSQYIVISFLY